MNEEQNNNECYPLDEVAIEQLEELDTQEKRLVDQANKALEQLAVARQFTLKYFIRVHKLTGDWKLAENKRELMKEVPAVQPTDI